MKVLVVGTPDPYQQEALDDLSSYGVEVVYQPEQVVEREPEVLLYPIESIQYHYAGDFPVIPKKERNYPTLRQHLRGHR